jgi:hypothetical protein
MIATSLANYAAAKKKIPEKLLSLCALRWTLALRGFIYYFSSPVAHGNHESIYHSEHLDGTMKLGGSVFR